MHSSSSNDNTDNISTKSSNACSICLIDLKDNIKTLECNHTFHNDCIDIWNNNNNTCPLCRKIINKPLNKLLNSNVIVPINIPLSLIPNNAQPNHHNNRINHKRIKQILINTIFIISFIGSLCCSFYIDTMIFKANKYINNLIHDKNTTELDGKSRNTFYADLLFFFDIIYYSLYILLTICIINKSINSNTVSCHIIFICILYISTWIIHSTFNTNSLSYLTNDIINIKNDYYKNNLDLSLLIFGIGWISKTMSSILLYFSIINQ